jgi:hypothetical protein
MVIFDSANIVIFFEMTKQIVKILCCFYGNMYLCSQIYKIGIENEKIFAAIDVVGDHRPDSWSGVAFHDA